MASEIDNLLNYGQETLRKQQEQQEQQDNEDIYAELREEVGEEDEDLGEATYPDPEISHEAPPMNEPEPDIAYSPTGDPEDYWVDDNETPIFEGGPSISQLDVWKKQFTNEKVFHTQILDRHFVFRTLNRYEYKQIVAIENVNSLYREEVICSTCVLFPFNYDFKAMAKDDSGYPSTLAEIIMRNSGFVRESDGAILIEVL